MPWIIQESNLDNMLNRTSNGQDINPHTRPRCLAVAGDPRLGVGLETGTIEDKEYA